MGIYSPDKISELSFARCERQLRHQTVPRQPEGFFHVSSTYLFSSLVHDLVGKKGVEEQSNSEADEKWSTEEG